MDSTLSEKQNQRISPTLRNRTNGFNPLWKTEEVDLIHPEKQNQWIQSTLRNRTSGFNPLWETEPVDSTYPDK